MPDHIIRPVPHYSDHIIDKVMPSLEVHLFGGPPGIGKTQLMLQILPAIERGEMVFGHKARPTKCIFVSCDRGERAHLRRLDNLGITHWFPENPPPGVFPFYSGLTTNDNVGYTLESIVKGCAVGFPDRELLFIDGFGSLCTESKDYNDVGKFLRLATQLCVRYNVTIIGSVHSPKAKEGQTYTNPREQILGSQAWGGFSDLLIGMQPADPKDPMNPRRLVHICCRAAAGDFTLKMILQNGRLVPDEAVERDLVTILASWLNSQGFERQIPTKEILEYGVKTCTLHPRFIERWIEEQVESGVLDRVMKGRYRLKMKA
jgi:hypothetical protein